MGVFVSYSDFNSNMYSYAVHPNLIPQVELDIDMYERNCMIRIFGLELADLILSAPTDPIYEPLILELVVNSPCFFKHKLISRGLKFALLGPIYLDLNKSNNHVGTTSGTKKVEQDLEMSGSLVGLVNMRFNESVNDIRAIQEYVRKHRTLYPKYDGSEFLLNRLFS